MIEDKTLNAIVIKNNVAFPNTDFVYDFVKEEDIKVIESIAKTSDNYLVLLIAKESADTHYTPDNVYNTGVVVKLSSKLKMPGSKYRCRFQVLQMVEIKEFILTEPAFLVRYDYSTLNIPDMLELDVIAKKVYEGLKQLNSPLKEVVTMLDTELDFSVRSHEVNCDIICNKLQVNFQKKLEIFLEKNLTLRFEKIILFAKTGSLEKELEREIDKRVQKSLDENQREYILREKLKAIQGELGDKVRKEEDVEILRKKINEANMPKEVSEKALYELNKYSSLSPQMAEAGITRQYLDFITNLPWSNQTPDNNDIKQVMQALDRNHYGLEKVKDRIVEYLAVKIKTNKTPQTILCLAGPPGVGKTSLAISIANALGRNFVKLSLGGVSDEAEIRGHRRTYVGALPGGILSKMEKAKSINPVFLLDEIDKMTSNYKGDPAAAMLEVLDPEQNSKFSDHYLEEPYDLSKVLFITTANYLENIPAPLRDRMEIVELSSYTEHEKLSICRQYLIEKQLNNHGITNTELTINDDALYTIIRKYTREAGVREVERLIGKIARKAVKEILVNEKQCINIDNENLELYLGKPRFSYNQSEHLEEVGVVTGLAYTQFGGDTLKIEAVTYPGKGTLTLTGKLGDVMKESAMTAFSYIKSNALNFKIDPKFFDENEIHIHVPEGATPKDGPSAGVAIATAILSVTTKRLIKKDIGMTGEITLTGTVLPIGGLREKSIAAQRSGLKTIFIPKENINDLDEVPIEVKNELRIIPVSKAIEVFDEVII